mgnify:CR=1 FL=1
MVAQTVELQEAQDHLSALVDEAARGQEVVLTRDGQPVAKIVPIPSLPKRRQFGSARGLITLAEDFDAPLEDFRPYT